MCSITLALTLVALTGVHPQDSAAFDRADRRARAVLDQIRCAQHVAALRQRGLFGPLDSLGRSGQCTVMDGRQFGVFFDADTTFSSASRVSAIDIATSLRRVEPIDTAAILAVARATRTAQLRGMAAYQRADRAFAPVAIRADGDSIEVWLVPVAVLSGRPVTVGGERGYVFSPDGRSITREFDEFEGMRTVDLLDTRAVRIVSRAPGIPTMTELLLANVLHARGRAVTIDTQRGSSTLTGDGDDAIWIHVAR